MFGKISPWEILVLLLIAVLLFGGKKLPELARGVGEAFRELKSSLRDDHSKKSEPKSVSKKS
ncbi:MAG: twin-arginine translocase TatA/TatE family subunit [Candidatus Dojkabacteria bacterium]|nr:twin-arginine translocase TatA/TatE family subunit [Candidatus Dojkabacteria bacterium]